MAGSTQVGRQGSTGSFANTIAPKSAEQAMLMKLDEMSDCIAALKAAVAVATDIASLQTAVAAVATPAKVALIR